MFCAPEKTLLLSLSHGTTSHRIQRATWHVPPDQWNVDERRNAGPSAVPTTSSKPSSSTLLSSSPAVTPPRSGSSPVPPDITRDVALKAIPKKRVKGNEESVWSEMRVLQGLDHPNVVRFPFSFPLPARTSLTRVRASSLACSPFFFFLSLRSSFMSGSNQDRNTISLLSSLLVGNSSSDSASVVTFRRKMPSRCFGMFSRFF